MKIPLWRLAAAALSALPVGLPAMQFRATVELATLDVRVTQGGRPVVDLVPSDIDLRINGRPRSVRQVVFIESQETPAASSAAFRSPAYWTNRATEAGRAFFVYFDQRHVTAGHERLIRDAALRFIDRLGTRDRVSIVSTSGTQVDLTTDHARVRDAVGAWAGGSRTWFEPAGMKLAWLQDFLNSIRAFDGPKNVILITEGLPENAPTGDKPKALELHEVALAALRAQAQLYVIRPQAFGIEAAKSDSRSEWDFEPFASLAADAGGETFEPAAGVDAIFEKIERESASMYVVGFSPEPGDADGKLHDVRVVINRPGVEVVARPAVVIDRTAPSPSGRLTTMDVLKPQALRRALELKAGAFAGPAVSGRVDLVVVAETASGAPISDAAIAMIDASNGRVRSAASVPRSDVGGYRVATGFVVAPGRYRIRVAVVSSTGDSGSVEFDYTALKATGDAIQAGDVLIGQSRADGTLEPRLTVGTEPSVVAYFTFTQTAPSERPATVGCSLASPAGSSLLVSAPGQIVPGRVPGQWAAHSVLSTSTLQPGEYVVQCRISVDGAVGAESHRLLRKEEAGSSARLAVTELR